MRTLIPLLCTLSLVCGEAAAQSVVSPNANAAARGTGGTNTLTRNAANPRTYMLGIPASQLAGIPMGAVINGVSVRSNVSASNPALWPPNDTTWSDYEVTVGNAIPVGTWTGTFATNFSGTPLMVRDGPMLIEANSFTNNSALPAPVPNVFGDFFWDFQSTFTYTGGDLGILFSHTGSSQATSAYFNDTVASAAGTGVGFTASTFQAPTGTAAACFVTRVHYGYGKGCPGTANLVPNLVQTQNVAGGGNVSFVLANSPPSTVAIYVIGAGATSTPLPNGCTLLTNPVLFVPLALNANGRVSFAASFPAGVALSANVQAFVIDVGAPSNYSASNGVTLTVTP